MAHLLTFRRDTRQSRVIVFCVAMLLFTFGKDARAQANPSEAANAGKNRILLVLPFDNATGQLSLDWIREAAPAILDARFMSSGFAPMSRADLI